MSEASNDQQAPEQAHKKGNEKGKDKAKEKSKAPKFDPANYPVPEFAQTRLALFDKLFAAQQAANAAKEKKPIKITLPDGSVRDGNSWETTPLDIAKAISQGLANDAIVAKVDGTAYDLTRPLEGDCSLEFLKWESAEAKHVFWHSSAHLLGLALERRFGGKLCVGPPLDDLGGFYYDMRLEAPAVTIALEHFDDLRALVELSVKDKLTFDRLVVSKSDALELFAYNQYKKHIIETKVADGETCTVYRCGHLIDLCRGPHILNSGRVKAFTCTKVGQAYWLGNKDNDSLQRVYGISFPSAKQLKEWEKDMEERKKRDHRLIGQQQELFFFDTKFSPGCCFFLPHGNRVVNKMSALLRSEYLKRGFTEVQSPNIFHDTLFETSGHKQTYSADMFWLESEGENFGLKPMNCPGHCLIFGHRARSYRELPLRLAEFGVLHRNEMSGALSGLTRVRRFVCDDAHIFCTTDQIEGELTSAFDFMKKIYGIFGFEASMELSTRPEKAIGDKAIWDRAESLLEKALNESGFKWKLNPGDGAFYGPKIDIHITDSMGRSHQCATIQLDFNLPERFQLSYTNEKNEEVRPVIVHRAIFGSLERFLAIFLEHTAGKWPLWLAPRQFLVVPVADAQHEFALKVQERLQNEGFYCDVDLADTTFNKKMALARAQQLYNYYLVVGQQEVADQTVNVRTRDNEVLGKRDVDALVAEMKEQVSQFK